MKKLFKFRLLILFPLFFLFVMNYKYSHTFSRLLNIGITLLLAGLILMYLFILYKNDSQSNKGKTIVNIGLIACVAFSIVFLRPYAENDVLDYKLNSYNTVENTVTGKITDYTLKETKYSNHQTIELNTAESNIIEYVLEQNIYNYEVQDIIEQDGHYFFAIKFEEKSSTNSESKTLHYILELDSNLEVIESIPLNFDNKTYPSNIKLIESDNDTIYYSSLECRYLTTSICDTTIHSVDKNGNSTTHFRIKKSPLLNGVIKDGNLYFMEVMSEFNIIKIQKYDLEGKLLQEKKIKTNLTDASETMILEDETIYINIVGYDETTMHTLDLNFKYIEDSIIFKPSLSDFSKIINDKNYSIEKDKSSYLINNKYQMYTLKKTGDNIYFSNEDYEYYQTIDDSGGKNVIEYKKLITNPIIIIMMFLLLFVTACDIFINYRVHIIKYLKIFLQKINIFEQRSSTAHVSLREHHDPFISLNSRDKR